MSCDGRADEILQLAAGLLACLAVVGANGQRQAMFLENVPGFAARILRNFDVAAADAALVVSSSGCNVVPVEIAEEFQRRGVAVVAIVSRDHLERSTSNDPRGKKLHKKLQKEFRYESLEVVKSRDFRVGPDEPAILGRVMLGGNGGAFDATLTVSSDGTTVTCAERVGDAI